jgi:hypothetical protein
MSLARAHRLVDFVLERGAAPSSHRAALIDARVTNLAIDVGAGYFERSASTRRSRKAVSPAEAPTRGGQDSRPTASPSLSNPAIRRLEHSEVLAADTRCNRDRLAEADENIRIAEEQLSYRPRSSGAVPNLSDICLHESPSVRNGCESDNVVPIVATRMVEVASAGDEPEHRFQSREIDGLGRKPAFVELLHAIHQEPRNAPLRMLDEDCIAWLELPKTIEDGRPGSGVDMSQDHRGASFSGGRALREPPGNLPIERYLYRAVGIAVEKLEPAIDANCRNAQTPWAANPVNPPRRSVAPQGRRDGMV